MKGETRERWQQLCAQAADEQDPQMLLELVKEINRILDEKERRLTRPELRGNPASADRSTQA